VNMKNSIIALTVAAPALLASTAMAQDPILSFGYTDLNGVFARSGTSGAGFGTGLFTANAIDVVISPENSLRSGGDVTRLSAPNGTAQFDTGFVSQANSANFALSLSVLNNDGDFADGAGSFTITDLNGDTVTGSISGTWVRGGLNQTFFNGDLANVQLNNISGDGLFNGNLGSFDLNLGFPGIFEGALVQLFLRPSADFFGTDFSLVSTQVSGEIVPTPGAAALMGLAGVAALRRRRK
jgi:uncharacterized protein (TIGR03382 family)